MDCSAIILNKLLSEKNVELWSKLKLVYIDPSFSSLYSVIGKYYDKYGEVPGFSELDLTLRDGPASRSLAIVKLATEEDIPVDVAFDALVDQYTQNETIKHLDKFIDKLPVLSTQEVKEDLSKIVQDLDEKTLNSEVVYNSSEIFLFRDPEEIKAERIPIGINNAMDALIGNCAREEYVLFGGKRGHGKSLVLSNIQCNEYEAGMVCPYFTIEMKAHEVFMRDMAMLSGVSHHKLKVGTYSESEALKLAKVRSEMFENGQDFLEKYREHRNLSKLEQELARYCTLKKDNQLIFIDDRDLSISSIDLHLGKLKAKHGDKLRIAIVDYVNQIVLGTGHDMYDWKPQIEVSKGLKNLARKHEVLLVSAYQIDDMGQARMAKGILDSPDIAVLLEADKEKQAINFNSTKIRGASEFKSRSGMDWGGSLRISPEPIELPESEEKPEEKPKKAKKSSKVDEPVDDAPPWD